MEYWQYLGYLLTTALVLAAFAYVTTRLCVYGYYRARHMAERYNDRERSDHE